MDLAFEEWDETRHWRKVSRYNTGESVHGLRNENVIVMLGHSVFVIAQNYNRPLQILQSMFRRQAMRFCLVLYLPFPTYIILQFSSVMTIASLPPSPSSPVPPA